MRRDAERLDPNRPTAELLRATYAAGLFPMADSRTGRIEWFCPDPRGVLPLGRFRVPGSLGRVVRSGRFDIRVDTAFEAVLEACAGPRSRTNPSWMSARLARAYLELHADGDAHSVEAWRDGRLVGGLYGVRLRGAFFGESMFVRPELGGTNASKACLVHLVERLRAGGFVLLDTQMVTAHLRQFGAVEIPASRYLQLLHDAMQVDACW